MRILHVSDVYLPRTGGIELHVRDLAAAQRARGDKVDILTLTWAEDAPVEEPGAVIIRPAGSGLAAVAWLLHRAPDVIAAGGYDVVHAHCSTVSPLAFSVLRRPSVPTVVTVHSLWRRYIAIYRTLDRCFGWSQWPVSVTAVSTVAAACVGASARRPLDLAVLPNGVDIAQWRQPLARTGAVDDRLRVIAVMRLALRKRPFALLKILRATRDQLPSEVTLHATIVGGGRWRGAMRRYIDSCGLAGSVRLVGELPRDEIARLMGESDIFIAPSTLESFGIAAAEARAAGVPVLGRSQTGLEQFIRDESDGVLVGSDAAMVECLVGAARNHGLVPLSDPAYPDTTVSSLDWSSVVAVTQAHYERTIATVQDPRGPHRPTSAQSADEQVDYAVSPSARSPGAPA